MIVSDLIIWNSKMIKRKATPITKTRKCEDTKEEGFIDSLALFRAFVLSCFRDGVFFCLLLAPLNAPVVPFNRGLLSPVFFA